MDVYIVFKQVLELAVSKECIYIIFILDRTLDLNLHKES